MSRSQDEQHAFVSTSSLSLCRGIYAAIEAYLVILEPQWADYDRSLLLPPVEALQAPIVYALRYLRRPHGGLDLGEAPAEQQVRVPLPPASVGAQERHVIVVPAEPRRRPDLVPVGDRAVQLGPAGILAADAHPRPYPIELAALVHGSRDLLGPEHVVGASPPARVRLLLVLVRLPVRLALLQNTSRLPLVVSLSTRCCPT